MGDKIIEQSIILQTKHGLALITGRAHAGVVEIVKHAKEMMHADISTVVGGFRLLNHRDKQVLAIIASLMAMGVRDCGATHCTGEKAIAAFRKYLASILSNWALAVRSY